MQRVVIGLALAAVALAGIFGGHRAPLRHASAHRARVHTPTPAPGPANPPPRLHFPPLAGVLIAGDSLTAGYGASDPATLGYAPLVVAGLGAASTAQVYGYPGDDSAQVLAALPADALSTPHGVVILETGTNDFDRDTLAQFTSAYSALVSAATATLPSGGFLLCLNTWHYPTQVNQFGALDSAYNGVIAASCHASGAYAGVVDITSLNSNPAYHATSGDTFHPNDAGHAAIKDAALALLLRLEMS